PGAGLERPGKDTVDDRKAAANRAAASDHTIECEGVLSRGRHWRRHSSKTAGQHRARALDHDDVLARIDDKHDLAFTRRPVRDAEVASRDSRIGAKRREARRLE